MDLKHGLPFGLIKNGLPYEYPKLEKDLATDVLVIGSGVSGALSAYELLNEGIECVVVDQRSVALGSTCASTSLLQYELDMPLHRLRQRIGSSKADRAYMMCSEAIDEIGNICRKIRCSHFTRLPSLYYAAYKKHSQLLEDEYQARQEAGFDVALMNEKDLQNEFGFSAPIAILSKQGAYLDAYAFTHALHQYGIRKGLQVYQRTGIKHIEYKKRSIVATTRDGYKIHAKKAVNASGYEVVDFIDAGLVSLHSTYVVASEQLSEHERTWKPSAMLWSTADPYLYMRQTDDNRVIIGGRDEAFFSPARRDKLLKKKSEQLTGDFNRLFPQMAFTPEFCWTGTFGITLDSLPYIGTYHKTPHTYYALGFGGNGITFSMVAARMVAGMIKGRTQPDAPLFAFDR